jgi:hypothetical protein
MYNRWPGTKCGIFALQKMTCVACALLLLVHVGVVWKPLRAMHFWNSGFKFAFGIDKKRKVFGILSHLKKLSKSNDVHAQNKTFISST